MIKVRHKGDFRKTEKLFAHLKRDTVMNALEQYGEMGVEALKAVTPVDSGKTAASWTYQIERNNETTRISWLNTNVQNGVNIAIILEYGHGTGTGGYVQGRDYINPAIKPVFDRIGDEVWKAVKNA